MELLLDVKVNDKKRTHPPNYSYAHIRKMRNARRNKNTNLALQNGNTGKSTSAFLENFAQINPRLVAPPYDKYNPFNYPPFQFPVVIPPGTNTSVPPPPLPIIPPMHPLFRYPRILPFVPPPPPTIDARLLELAENATRAAVGSCFEEMQMLKMAVPPPPLHPVHPNPPTSAFLESTNVAYQHEVSRLFAEHTIKAALGIAADSNTQNPQ